jgi:hypothetical protein
MSRVSHLRRGVDNLHLKWSAVNTGGVWQILVSAANEFACAGAIGTVLRLAASAIATGSAFGEICMRMNNSRLEQKATNQKLIQLLN